MKEAERGVEGRQPGDEERISGDSDGDTARMELETW